MSEKKKKRDSFAPHIETLSHAAMAAAEGCTVSSYHRLPPAVITT